ncbi:MAG: hypothetical protein ACRDYZ_16365 [Acidimicrobiales bacterium]
MRPDNIYSKNTPAWVNKTVQGSPGGLVPAGTGATGSYRTSTGTGGVPPHAPSPATSTTPTFKVTTPATTAGTTTGNAAVTGK